MTGERSHPSRHAKDLFSGGCFRASSGGVRNLRGRLLGICFLRGALEGALEGIGEGRKGGARKG